MVAAFLVCRNETERSIFQERGCGSVGECLFRIHDAIGLIPSNTLQIRKEKSTSWGKISRDRRKTNLGLEGPESFLRESVREDAGAQGSSVHL